MNILQVLQQRDDISLFITHLTKETEEGDAKTNLESILDQRILKAENIFGFYRHPFMRKFSDKFEEETQKCVCFTETPFENIQDLLNIDNRSIKLSKYGIMFTRKDARDCAVNPVWYLDESPAGHSWLTNAIVKMAEHGTAETLPELQRLLPFFESMYNREDAAIKEFWWEREWRHSGNLNLGSVIGLCDDTDIVYFSDRYKNEICFFDIEWAKEKIIEHAEKYSKLIKRNKKWDNGTYNFEQNIAKLCLLSTDYF